MTSVTTNHSCSNPAHYNRAAVVNDMCEECAEAWIAELEAIIEGIEKHITIHPEFNSYSISMGGTRWAADFEPQELSEHFMDSLRPIARALRAESEE